ncbi:MAG TPA: carbohydrate-binding family 9-like protein [Phycisphaerae bacterium]|nr:carbohydrate-binding family 9-like protein [Phycisphaerae bacterium]HRW53609.1 carbohydrate-binding family 9-like protein [Phycisphaerae bacterium]
MRIGFFGVGLLGVVAISAGCQNDGRVVVRTTKGDVQLPRDYTCVRAAGPVSIDGSLDDPSWSAAAWSEDFADIEGFDSPTPRYRTRMKMLWDDTYLYIGAELEEPHVWATLRNHDDIVFNDNDFEIFIDPNGDEAEYYEIEMNALETIFDLFLVRTYLRDGPALHDWDMRGLKKAVRVNGTLNDPTDEDQGWSVEFALPWRSLKEAAGCDAPPKPGDTWRLNFSRVEWRHEIIDGKYQRVSGVKEDNWVWSPQGVIDMHRPQHWGYVKFASGRTICTLPVQQADDETLNARD